VLDLGGMAKRIAWSVGVGILALSVTFFWRGFPPRLAVLSGVAVGILVYTTLRAVGLLATLYRRP